jgi:hypothetical protein
MFTFGPWSPLFGVRLPTDLEGLVEWPLLCAVRYHAVAEIEVIQRLCPQEQGKKKLSLLNEQTGLA